MSRILKKLRIISCFVLILIFIPDYSNSITIHGYNFVGKEFHNKADFVEARFDSIVDFKDTRFDSDFDRTP